MMKQIQLVSRAGVILVLTVMVGTSAFADSRPQKETRGKRDGRAVIHRGSSTERATATRGDRSANGARQRGAAIERRSEQRDSNRTDARTPVRGDRVTRGDEQRDSNRTDARTPVRGDRVTRGDERARSTRGTDPTVDRGSAPRETRSGRGSDRYDRERSNNNAGNRGSHDRGRDGNRSGREETRRGDTRSGRSTSHDRSSYDHSNRHRQPHYSHGRVSRTVRYGSGYRVWVYGTPYPFFIPLAYYNHDRYRVGLSINLGGYYNPLGYYDYYDGRSSGGIRGVVESVDYRRDSFVIRNEASGSFVTVLARDRRLDVRAGDYVEISGQWTRSGLFQAFDVDLLDDGYRR